MRPRYILYALFILHFSFSSPGEEKSGDVDSRTGGVEAELSALRKENSMLRKELSEVLLKNRMLEDERLKFELGVVRAVADPGEKSVSDRELQMLKDMLLLKDAVDAFSSKVAMLSLEMDKLMAADPVAEDAGLSKAKLKLALDELKEASGKLAKLMAGAVERPNLETCSVLDVDDRSGTLVLSAGSSDGAFCGLILHARDGGGQVVRIIAVRPFASSAMIVEGSLGKVTPGTVFVPGKGE